MTVPAIGAATIDLGADAVDLLELGDLLVGAAEDAQPVARRGERDLGRAQVALRADQVGLRLLEVLQRAAADRQQLALALLAGLRERQPRLRLLDAGDGGDEIVLALHELARLDGEQRRAALDVRRPAWRSGGVTRPE